MNLLELKAEIDFLIAAGKGDQLVMFAHNSGDYWRTQVARTIDTIEGGVVTFSDYHNMYKVVADEDDRGERSVDVIIFS